jgi:hypothetical protein
MSDERNARPVSGEIMAAGTAGAEPARAGSPAMDVVDAEFETLRPDPRERMVPSSPVIAIGTMEAPSQGLGTLRKNDPANATPQGRSRGGPIFWIVGLGLVAGAFWVSGGHALVRQSAFMLPAPQVQPANPLRIAEVTSRVEDHGGRKILFVDGRAVNESDAEQSLPPIEISVTANGGGITRYNLGTSQDPLAAGGAFSFSSRLEAPKEGVQSVSVTFQE